MSNYSIYDGIHGLVPQANLIEVGFIAAFMALSLWMVLEFHVQVFRSFKKRNGLYFWSLVVLSWGVLLHSIGYLLNWFAPGCPWQVYALMDAIGWSMMVTAESLVLYSRMHLVTRNRKVHRFVLGMIIFTTLFVQIPNWVISIPAVSQDVAVSAVWSPRDSIETRIQQVAFLLQEGTISTLYIYFTGKLLKPNIQIRERRVMLDLIYVNACVIILDVMVIILAFTNQHLVKEPLQNVSYALKLKLEFFVLNQLMEISQDAFPNGSGKRGRYMAPSSSVQSPDGRLHSDDSQAMAQKKPDFMVLSHSISDASEHLPRSKVQYPIKTYSKANPPRHPPLPPSGTSPSPVPAISSASTADAYSGNSDTFPEQRASRSPSTRKPLPPTPLGTSASSWLHLSDHALCSRVSSPDHSEADLEAGPEGISRS